MAIKNTYSAIALLFLVTTTYYARNAHAANPDFLADKIKHRQALTNNDHSEEGIKFSCGKEQLQDVEREMLAYLNQLGIPPALVNHKLSPNAKNAIFQLTTPPDDISTVDLRFRPEMEISDQLISLPSRHGKPTTVLTVSEKEIVLSLMQHGRLTEFSGDQCSFQVFRDHVGIRQNIVAWAENIEWNWPEGKRARWNKRYWKKGTPLPDVSMSKAVADAFLNQEKYSIGCYTATKLVMIHGVLDYYARIKNSPAGLTEIEQRLMADDNDPLVRIEPRAVWAFEEDFDASELWQKGKLLEMRYNIPARNFVPGDWGYILNTDPITAKKIGYEGSNAIYLGRGKFDDYYNDHNHSYLFREKLDEVYQWRNKVFSRRRDIAKVRPLTERDIEKLEATPEKGGLVMDMRVYFPPFSPRSANVH
ncbi:MAG: hypothetical protein V4500_04640 [Pseudomonadota bacterium]